MFRQFMFKLSCAILAIVVLFCYCIPVYAHSESSHVLATNGSAYKNVYSDEECIYYFERSDYRTINALCLNETEITVYFHLAEDPSTVYSAYILNDGPASDLLTITAWQPICEEAFGVASSCSHAIDFNESSALLTVPRLSILEIYADMIIDIYGEPYDDRLIGSRLFDSNKYVTIREDMGVGVDYAGEVITARSMSLAAFATLLDVTLPYLCPKYGETISAAATFMLPKGTSVYKYNCGASFEKRGLVDGTVYFRAYRDVTHIGIIIPEDVNNDIDIDPTPAYDFYSPSSEIYNSYDAMVNTTIEIYHERTS